MKISFVKLSRQISSIFDVIHIVKIFDQFASNRLFINQHYHTAPSKTCPKVFLLGEYLEIISKLFIVIVMVVMVRYMT